MRETYFFRLGSFIYQYRRTILMMWGLLILCCIPFIPQIMKPFFNTGFIDEQSPSAKTDTFLNKKLKYNYKENRIIILYRSESLKASNPQYIKQLKDSLSGIKKFSIKHDILFPDMNKKQISKDKHSAYVIVTFDNKTKVTPALLSEFQQSIKKPHGMTMTFGGESVFINDLAQQTRIDLFHADLIAAPLTVITLLIVFGTVIASIIPVFLGAGCALMLLTSLFFIASLCTLSIFTINIALLLGLCLSLDYALFIISRFREELLRQPRVQEAMAMTMATAGKAVFFSGLAVLISLSALLLFPVNLLFSVGVGGMAAVFFAVMTANLILPAVLSVLNWRINGLPIPWFSASQPHTSPLWHALATTVVKRRILFFISSLVLLLFLGAPFLNARFGVSDQHILPKQAQSHRFFDAYSQQFNAHELTPIVMVITTKDKAILSSKNIGAIYDFSKQLKKNPFIQSIDSIVTTKPLLRKAEYQHLYTGTPPNADVEALLKETTRQQLTMMSITSALDINAPQMNDFIKTLRDMPIGKGLELQVTGVPVTNWDVLDRIDDIFPYAITWIMLLTYLILLLLLRSLFLPLKAILMNMLSLSASYGILVFVFQEGHLHDFLHFSPQGMVDVSLLVIIFCALFGFSMDYEVFLLTRIQEAYKKKLSNDQSIVFGIEHSSRIITSAALIVIFICASFMVADVLMVKEFGLGIAVAIFVDAFIVRSILVPSTMALVKQWNWYLPQWLDKLLP